MTAEWFRSTFAEITAPQREGWPAIARGDSTLILAPTGTGKTLTAFLWCLDRLIFRTGPTTPGTKVLYISPLKALAVDVERNLQAPLAGITALAAQNQTPTHPPSISIRTGDTKPNERARFKRNPGEILITTPESLYLLLTSGSAEALRSIETVIIDEIHALVPTKRGAHLMLSLERLEALCNHPIQRIGLSATQRPLDEVARFLGGAKPNPNLTANQEIITTFRPVTIVNAGARKQLNLSVQVSVEDLATLGPIDPPPNDPDTPKPRQTSIWQSIHPRLVEIIRSRTSTLIFVNNRRTAERLAGSINEYAGEPLARAHHGSLAAAQRTEIEQLLKDGQLRAIVCTSSLELGIDMGAIDMVIQIEAPPSVASALQRIGRAGHQVGAPSTGIIFPKYRADLLACAAATQAMHAGLVESTRFLRNPLDILAQQIVAIVAHPPLPGSLPTDDTSPGISHAALLSLVRSSAPFATLSTNAFNGVLDMLSGLYPSDEFAELRPRITWDRTNHWLTPRQGSKRIAILNGGTIPDRGLYGVFLANSPKPVRIGELDEEMVFEARAGEVFLLGASSWRIDQITHDQVLVTPAPGQPGKLPFWHGDRPGRPIEFGRLIGQLVRELRSMSKGAAIAKLTREHDLDVQAAENVLRYITDQELAAHTVPDDRTILIERVRDELGDWRVCVLTPFGSRVHAPWA
ncbi:MAG: DEAD/DEAH box helicase, partial [Acidobacteriaceae bacterium]